MRLPLPLTIIFLLFTFIHLANAQSQYYKFDDLKDYYSHIYQAELSIISDLKTEAIGHYRKASLIKPLIFADRLNLIQSFLDSGRMAEAVSTAIQLANDGYRLGFLNDKKYEELINDENWIYFATNTYVSPPISIKTNNIGSMLSNMGQYYEISAPEKRILYLDIVTQGLRKMIKEKGYPSDIVLQYGSKDDLGSKFENLMKLCIGSGNFNQDSLFYDQFLQGNMEPETIVYFLGFAGNNSCGCEPFKGGIYIQIENKLYSCTKNQTELADKNRAKLFLPSISETKKMIDFQYSGQKNYKLRMAHYDSSVYYIVKDNKAIFDIEDYSEQLELFKTLNSSNFYFQKKD